MLILNDGRKELYQWDTGRTATVDIECDIVHFANLKYGQSLAVEVKGGEVSVPNKLLMNCDPIYCWAFVKDDNGAYTKKEQTIAVTKRAKPSDYVYTETDVITVNTAVEKALEEAKESGAFKGDSGANGKDGTSVTVSSVSESTADGGENIVTFSDGKILTVKNGSRGSQGDKGEDGEPREVVQVTGQSKTAVMSQKATTDELINKLPKSPVNWEPWTAEEQAAARDRMGIPGDYVLIEDITLEEDVDYISRSEEPDGTQYRFSAFCIIADIIVPDSENRTLRIDADSYKSYNLFLNYFQEGSIRNKRINLNYEALSPNLFKLSSEINEKSTVLYTKGAVSVRDMDYYNQPILSTIVRTIHLANITMLAGTKIRIYGVRA